MPAMAIRCRYGRPLAPRDERVSSAIRSLCWHVLACLLPACPHASSSGLVSMRGSSSSSSDRRRLQPVGKVKAFESELHYYVPLPIRTHPERANLDVEHLGFAHNSSNQETVMLQYFEPFKQWGTLAECRGDTCPSMAGCGPQFPNLKTCWNPDLVDTDRFSLDPPVNCPKKVQIGAKVLAEDRGREGLERTYDKSCSHPEDSDPRYPLSLQMIQLQGVFVTHKGFVFNRTHRFLRSGCARARNVAFPEQHQVHVLPAAFNWGYTQGFNFYHFIVETMPLFRVAAPLLPTLMKTMPIIADRMQWKAYRMFGEALIGVKHEDIRALPLVSEDLFFVETLYEPMTQRCGNPSLALWQSLRRRHLLHPTGLPLFRSDWSYHPPAPLSAEEAQALPKDWVVVVARRLTKKRSISNFNEVEQQVEAVFGKERIVLYNGSLSVLEARALFRRVRLFVAGHGAALTNLVFMPEKASVLEIRPDGCPVVCYNHLTPVRLPTTSCSVVGVARTAYKPTSHKWRRCFKILEHGLIGKMHIKDM